MADPVDVVRNIFGEIEEVQPDPKPKRSNPKPQVEVEVQVKKQWTTKQAAAIVELLKATTAAVAAMRSSDPERLERTGWKRIIAALSEVGDVDFAMLMEMDPIARATDPGTSHKAAEMATWRSGGDKWKLCEVFYTKPAGLTAEEAVLLIRDDGRGWQRVSDLVAAGILVETGEERVTSLGAPARVMVMSESARLRWFELGRT